MSGFATGFEAGYGLVSRDMAQRRRDELAREKLEADRIRDADLAEYRGRTADAQDERIGLERKRLQVAERDSSRRRANEAVAMVNESDEIFRQARRDRAAQARQEKLDRLDADERTVRLNTLEMQGEQAALELQQARLRQSHQTLVAGLSGNADPDAILDAIAQTRGTPYNPAFYFGQEAGRRLQNAADFASGTRKDYRSEDFIDAVDFALSADTSLMRGMPNARGGTISDMKVIGVEPVAGEDGVPQGVHVKVRVNQEGGGSYTTYLTSGRSTRADAERAVVPIDHILQSVVGHTYQASALRDPEALEQVRSWVIQSDPKRATEAIRAADRAYEADAKTWSDNPSNTGVAFPQSRQDYYDAFLQRSFGSSVFESADPGANLLQELRAQAEAAGATGLTDEELLRVYQEG